jgi:mucin-2
MASKKHVDPLKAKQKRQKIIAAVLGVLFVGVLAFQVPRVMKMMKTPPNPHANDSVTTTTATGTPSLAAPTLRGAEQPASTDPTTGAPVAVSNTPTVQDGQLASFSRFASKDPFNQQLSDDKGSSAPSSSSGGSGSGSGSAGSGGTSSPPQVPSSSSPRPGSAVISVNGTLYTVATASDFPQANPLFHLVSVTAHSAKISIAGGSYSSGAPTVTLKENKPVTLVNTADGTRYTLVLKPLGTGVPGGSTTSSAGSGTSSSGSGSSGSTTTTPSSTTVTLPSP